MYPLHWDMYSAIFRPHEWSVPLVIDSCGVRRIHKQPPEKFDILSK